MSRIEVFLPDASADELGKLSSAELSVLLEQAERFQELGKRQDEAALRKVVVWYLLGAATVVLLFSLAAIGGQAIGWLLLPDAAITTLVGSVAVEFVGMLWMAVRYLFPRDR